MESLSRLSARRSPRPHVLLQAVIAATLTFQAAHATIPLNEWINATATCYGGGDGSGTITEAACGYGNLMQTGYGLNNVAPSVALFNNGWDCGTCWEIQCSGTNYGTCLNNTITVTATNLCPNGSEGGWCNNPKSHFDLSCPMWNTIASPPEAGVVRVRARKVPCKRTGGAKVSIQGNPYWLQFLFFNVGGPGALSKADVSANGGVTWTPLNKDWGARWSLGTSSLQGQTLSFRLTGLTPGSQVVLKNAVPSGWKLGMNFTARQNFW